MSLWFPFAFPVISLKTKALCVGGPASLDARQALRLAGGVWVLRGARQVCRLPFGLTYNLGPESDMRFLLGVEFVWFDLRPLYRNVDHFRGSSNHFSGSRDRSIRLIYPESRPVAGSGRIQPKGPPSPQSFSCSLLHDWLPTYS